MAQTPFAGPQAPIALAPDPEALAMATEAPQAAPEPAVGTQAPSMGAVNVVNPDGELVSIPHEQASDAIQNLGYRAATDDDVHAHLVKQKYGTTSQQIIGAGEGVAKGFAGPLATAAERAIGVPAEDILGREEASEGGSGLGEAIGLGAGMFTGAGEAALMEHAGSGALKAAGMHAPAGALAKIGSAATKAAVENAVFQAGDEASKMILQDPNQSVETAAVNVGLAGLIGVGAGGAIGSINPLWKATMGTKVGTMLKALSDRAGGIEGQLPDAVEHAIAKTGIAVPDEIRAALSDDPHLQQIAKTLEQSDTTGAGVKYQEAMGAFRKRASDIMVEAFGKDPAALEGEMPSKYEAGKGIGGTLAGEYQEKLGPLAKEFEDLKGKYADAPLPQDSTLMGTTPGTTSVIADRLAQLGHEQLWAGSGSDMEKELNRVLKALPSKTRIFQLGELATQVGDITKSTLNFGQQTPLSRAGMLIKNVLRDAENDAALAHLGEKAPELVERYKAARDAYRQLSLVKEQLNDRLKVGGSTSGFAKGLREMANTDGEAVVNRLSGSKDAHLLGFLQENFPKTAQAIKDFHIDALLRSAAMKAKEGQTISPAALRTALDKMSPELRQFAIPGETIDKVNGIGAILDQLNKVPHNFSNTARTMDKLMGHLPGSAVGMATMLAGHNPAIAFLMGAMVKPLAKDVPDAVRLSLLKFLGSRGPVQPGAFKAMVETINHIQEGEHLINRATKNIFRTGVDVLAASKTPTEAERIRLDKSLLKIQEHPQAMLNMGENEAGHYMPEHAAALAQAGQRGVNYINSLRPNLDPRAPLDTKVPPTKAQQASFNRALDIAQQPLTVLDHMAKGTMTPQDVAHLKMLYPALYGRLSQKLMAGVIEHSNDGKAVPYKTRMGLSMFLGQPLDSTMTPAGIMAAQPQPPANQPQTATQPASNPKRSMNALNKLPSMYSTPSQKAAEQRGKQ